MGQTAGDVNGDFEWTDADGALTGHISWKHLIKSGISCDVDLTNREIGPLFLRNELIEIPAETNHILELIFSDFGGGTQNVRWAGTTQR